ncbi:MAG: hypothetical protein CR976_01040, partial [Thiotrichales bacterium]
SIRFPAENELSEDLPDEVYQLHFGDAVKVLSVQIRNGDQQYCVLPVNQPLRETLDIHLSNTLLVRHLKRDMSKLHSLLSTMSHNNKDVDAPVSMTGQVLASVGA